MDLVNTSALIGCWITFLILTCILNGVVIGLVISLYVTRPAVRKGLPKLFVILVCCVLQIVGGVVPDVAHQLMLYLLIEWEFTYSCETRIFITLGPFMGICVVSLLVGAVVMVEGLRLQSFVTLSPRIHLTMAVTLVVSAVLYGFAVIIPLFYFRFLSDETTPCFDSVSLLDIDTEHHRDIDIGTFIVPQCLVFMASLLLLVVYFTWGSGSRPAVSSSIPLLPHTMSPNPAPLPHAVSRTPADPGSTTHATNTDTCQRSDPSLHMANNPDGMQQQPAGMMSSRRDVRLPWYVLFAATVSFWFQFPDFLQVYADLKIPFDDLFRLSVATWLLLTLKGVFLPCCWLLDRDVRTAWCCCRGPQPAGELTGIHREEERVVTARV